MSRLENIPVRVEVHQTQASKPNILEQVLQEIHLGLTDLHASGITHAIDLRQLPRMSAAVYQALREALAQGEVSAVVQAQVKVEVQETQFPGVWWLRHFNERDEITTEIIEITVMPTILKPHRMDLLAGLQKLEERLRMGASPTESMAAPA